VAVWCAERKLSMRLFRFCLPFVKNSGTVIGTLVCPCLFNNDIFDARHESSCLNTQKLYVYI
jgi:hypothetical protein